MNIIEALKQGDRIQRDSKGYWVGFYSDEYRDYYPNGGSSWKFKLLKEDILADDWEACE